MDSETIFCVGRNLTHMQGRLRLLVLQKTLYIMTEEKEPKIEHYEEEKRWALNKFLQEHKDYLNRESAQSYERKRAQMGNTAGKWRFREVHIWWMEGQRGKQQRQIRSHELQGGRAGPLVANSQTGRKKKERICGEMVLQALFWPALELGSSVTTSGLVRPCLPYYRITSFSLILSSGVTR